MAKQDEIYALARVALENRTGDVIKRIQCMAANEPERSTLKQRLTRLLAQHGQGARLMNPLPLDRRSASLVRQTAPTHTLDEVVLPPTQREAVRSLLAEQRHAEALWGHNLRPSSRLLLIGPPGTGKTILAGAIADALERPFLCVEYARLISCELGGTGANISKLLDGLNGRCCVLFLDEMETLLSERAGSEGRHDVGEQARIVSTLLLALDRLGPNVMFIGATNHAELLDRAVRRRFDMELSLPLASAESVTALARTLCERHPGLDMARFVPREYEGCSLAAIERTALSRARAWVIGQAEVDQPDSSCAQGML